MHFSQQNILELDKIFRLNLINSISGIKPANLIGTQSLKGQSNLAIFNSVMHLGTNPPLQGFILRPFDKVPRHTYRNILDTGFYTINHVHPDFSQQAHFTSAKFPADVSEFDAIGLTEEFLFDFPAPFVKQSIIKMGMKYISSVPIPQNDTTLVIGEIQHLEIPKKLISDEGYLNLSKSSTGISGLNRYYKLSAPQTFPFARPEQLPDFNINQE